MFRNEALSSDVLHKYTCFYRINLERYTGGHMNIATYIEHTLLAPDATPAQITRLCAEALRYGFASVVISSSYVPLASALLKGSSVNVCTVIGFSSGATMTAAKVCEATAALAEGATELDMVLHIGKLKSGDHQYVGNEIATLALIAHKQGAILKVIIETCLLTDAEKRTACQIADGAGADFVKTSTGFSARGATISDIVLMRAAVGPLMGVKASGGIGDYATAKAMIDAGATRIGTSKSIAIVGGAPKEDIPIC